MEGSKRKRRKRRSPASGSVAPHRESAAERSWDKAPLPSQRRSPLSRSEFLETIQSRPKEVNKSILKSLVRVPWQTLNGGNPLTYIMSGHVGLNHKIMEDIFAQLGWSPVPPDVDRAMFVWVELVEKSGFDKRVYGVQCELKNVVNDEKLRITDKWRLYMGLSQYFPEIVKKHMAATKQLKYVSLVPEGRQLICKPVGRTACAGNGIVRIETTDKLRELKPLLLKENPDYIACEYISDLLLWHGRKFHLRMYWLVRPEHDGKPFFQKLHDTGKIMTAALPYVNDAFDNKHIHDTHVKSTLRNLFFPNDLDGVSPEQCIALFEKMEDVLSYVGRLLNLVHLGPYPESKRAYEVFGCDFLVTSDMNVILLEINQRIGMRSVPTDTDQEHYDEFAKHYYRWVYDNAIAPMLEGYIRELGVVLPELPPPPPPVKRRVGEDPPFPTPEELALLDAAEEMERLHLVQTKQRQGHY